MPSRRCLPSRQWNAPAPYCQGTSTLVCERKGKALFWNHAPKNPLVWSIKSGFFFIIKLRSDVASSKNLLKITTLFVSIKGLELTGKQTYNKSVLCSNTTDTPQLTYFGPCLCKNKSEIFKLKIIFWKRESEKSCLKLPELPRNHISRERGGSWNGRTDDIAERHAESLLAAARHD